jgi:hypothetical protein
MRYLRPILLPCALCVVLLASGVTLTGAGQARAVDSLAARLEAPTILTASSHGVPTRYWE